MKRILVSALAFLSSIMSFAFASCASQDNCVEAVIVIRHAEDTTSGKHALTTAGERHAQLYEKFFAFNFIDNDNQLSDGKRCLCPIKRIITVDPNGTSNPLNTILPFASEIGLDKYSIEYFGNDWHTDQRLKLLSQNNQTSTLISWTRQGLWGNDSGTISDDSLLAKIAGNMDIKNIIIQGASPMHDNIYIFTDQDKNTGKFNKLNLYHQMYQFDPQGKKYICYHRLRPEWGDTVIFEPIKMNALHYDECKWETESP